MELFAKNVGNPWMVEELEEFLYYCCPECNEKCRVKGSFLQHALGNHPNVSITYPMDFSITGHGSSLCPRHTWAEICSPKAVL